ncbi:NAD(P)-dependent dehydrogenase (short-subunit alcohol dehydrogenase family) [Neolewinella xylanilytica]|uniref:NAD(P)-dependent dehydrogenase (Short-subunit alcohol dehydrogenase family) n=1 Tax=Neolewinella xylanilytica TaxID=1514080 RepID=A0A2S6I4Z3_9BACT|nr:3-ketoacyl-ACP reductase [Neolewinella xylanilytica]PPK86220.1 NAD(P)-dependent dehydrogenase (short-subunit alcohol dehydrogenase family) [Neolewinella xylanilytica]
MARHPTALVTGGSRGIGLGIVRALIAQDYEVALNGVRAEAEVFDLLAELRDLSERDVHYVQGNIGDTQDRARIVEEAYGKLGHLNVLVNNAGVAPRERSDLLELSEHSYDRVMDINLKGPFFLTQAIARRMVADRAENDRFQAYIINVGSISATVASTNRGQYCTSKAGMGMMTQLFAARLAAEGIPVYELRPGIIKTDMTSVVTEKYDRLIAEGLTLQPRWGYPKDVGRAVAALVRGDFPYSTGQVIMIDGGLTLQRL